MVALHAVEEGGDGILQSLQELLMVLLGLPVLVLLLKTGTRGERKKSFVFCTQKKYYYQHPLKVLTYLHYVDWLDRGVTFCRLTDWRKGLSQWHRGRG